ncbi:MAG: sulfotransferase [Desulfotignum sp.]|nr:sulfotransferase [Desulfotignum sp.]MCF8086442.1 sulfotransferase [Desulfotignum sp.]MCF8135844.1 sulfotransferase [Desulfotignum sp.]
MQKIFTPKKIKISDPFFIVGNSRSGTTLLSRILKNNPAIHVLKETHFFEEYFAQISACEQLDHHHLYKMVNQMITVQRKDYYRKSEYQEYPEQADKILAEFYQANNKRFQVLIKIFFADEAKRLGKNLVGDQTPRHVFYADEILTMYPGAKIIHLVRDPRAVLYSQKKKWASGLQRGQPLFEVIRTFINYHPVTMSLLWCKAINAGRTAEKRHGTKKIRTLLFEEFVKEPKFHVSKICEFLGESFHPGMLDVTVEFSATRSQEGHRGISQEVTYQWKKGLNPAEVFLCEKIAGQLMTEMKYPLSGNRPDLFHLGLYVVWLPLHLGIAFVMNLGRMGNPIKYISKRFFQEKCR